jgi:serine/threonine protein kinase
VTSSAAVRAADGLEGKLVAGRYRVKKRLGEGGMGEVFLAQHEAIEKRVALKILRAEYSTKADVVARFQLEAKSASRMKHPNVVDVFDFGSTEDGRFFLALEYLDGCDLADELHKLRTIDPARAVQIMVQVCAGLGSAHENGVVHRDMKPENVFLQRGRHGFDEVKIVDFGIAKMREISGGEEGKQEEGERRLTKAGSVFGTPEYMAPEQATGKEVDHAVDIYAVGVMLYEVLTGKVPFNGDSMVHTLTMHVHESPPPFFKKNPHIFVSEELEAVVMKALSKTPLGRFATMESFSDALRATPEGASLLPSAPAHRRLAPRSAPSGHHLLASGTGPTPLSISVTQPPSDSDELIELGEPLAPLTSSPSIELRHSDPPMPLVTRARASGAQLDFSDEETQVSRLRRAEEAERHRSRAPLLALGGALLLAVGAGGAIALGRGGIAGFPAGTRLVASPAPPALLVAAAGSAGADARPPGTVDPALAASGSDGTAANSAAAAPPEPAASTAPSAAVVLTVLSEPPGAVVRKGGFQVCDSTPCDVTAELNEAVELSGERGDWKGTAKVMALRNQTVKIRLARPGPLPAGARPPAAAPTATTTSTAGGRVVSPVPMCEVMDGDLKTLRPCK